MDREQFKKEFEQFSKELNEEFKNGLIDGVLITKGGNKNHLFDKEEARRFFDKIFSLADEFEEMNKKDGVKENDFSSFSFRTKLYQAVREEYSRFINSKYRQNKYYSSLNDEKVFEKFYTNFFDNVGVYIEEYVETVIKQMEKEERVVIRFSPLGSRNDAVLALLSGKIVIDETMRRDGKNFYTYKDGSFYRIEDGKRPVIVDFGKLISKEFFEIQIG